MTFTSEERRAVAERLRDSVQRREYLDESVVKAIYLVLNGNATHRPIGSILADFVDPTCEVDSVEQVDNELGQLDGFEFILTCGHTFKQPYNEPPAYCPYCGARVVDDE